jgi:hypothetical protein
MPPLTRRLSQLRWLDKAKNGGRFFPRGELEERRCYCYMIERYAFGSHDQGSSLYQVRYEYSLNGFR